MDTQQYWSKPMIVGSSGSGYDFMDCANNMGVQRLQHDTGELKGTIKDASANIRYENAKSEADIRQEVRDAECNIRHDIGQTECALTKTVMSAECNLSKEILETRHTLAKDILKAEYENRLATQAAIKEINDKAQYNTDRSNDKNQHYFEKTFELLKTVQCCACSGGVGALSACAAK